MSMRKEILCDSSALISLTDSCFIDSLKFIAKKFSLNFIITDKIEYECVTHPLNLQTKEYSFSALRIRNALSSGALVKVGTSPAIEKKRDEVLLLSNNIFFAQGKPLTLVQAGEAEMIALANELRIKHILMDERTTRLLIEAPFRIKDHFEQEFRTNVMVNRENLEKFTDVVRGMEVFRSTEFISLAYEHGFFDDYGSIKKDVYAAALYKLKYSGCAIRYDEIEELIKTV